MTQILGYTYGADYHCVDCATVDGMTADDAVDSEGNTPGVIFSTDEGQPFGIYCSSCGAEIQEPFWTIYDGYGDWPDWDGVDECLCGLAINPELGYIPDPCPNCGREPWELVAQECEGCHQPVYPYTRYYLSDWGDVRHLACKPEL